MSDRENLSGFDMQEYWDYLHSMNKQFNEIFGVNDESTQQTKQRTDDATRHEAE